MRVKEYAAAVRTKLSLQSVGRVLRVQVFRMSSDSIGCSLAEAAESADYTSYLQQAACTPRSLHVVYINTSLRTKATAHNLVPTITCTSSNVVQTVLQAFAQVG
jgi:quinolinate synthase